LGEVVQSIDKISARLSRRLGKKLLLRKAHKSRLRAKKIIETALRDRGLAFTKLTARTVDSPDLARPKVILLTIHGWKPSPLWSEIAEVARVNGFRVEAQASVQLFEERD
jgi:hypothetical protein